MKSYDEIFHEDYNSVVREISFKRSKRIWITKLRLFFNKLFKKHLQISDYEFWAFSKLAYSNRGILQEFISPKLNSKFEIIDFINEVDGLQFYVIKSKITLDLVVVFRGTDEWIDWKTNVKILQKKGQFLTAKRHLELILNNYIDYDLYFVGHSLGGALAQEMCLIYQPFANVKIKRVVTFNTAGVRLKSDNAHVYLPIINYIIEKDIVGNQTGYHYGETIYLKESFNIKTKNMLKLYTHTLDQFIFDHHGKVKNEKITNLEIN